jgi:hypothetical protein
MFYYKIKLEKIDGVITQIDGYQTNGKLTKKAAEQIAREELADPQYAAATVYSSNGTRIYQTQKA